MTLFPYLAARLIGVPLAVHPGKAAAIIAALGPRLFGVEIEVAGADPLDHVAGRLGDPLGQRLARDNIDVLDRHGSLAVIAIEGSLIHKGKFIGASSGQTSYEGVQSRLRQAMADSSIEGVVLEIDSFGGEVAGAFDTAAMVRALSDKKPTMAILTDHALSAGYLLASGAREIVAPLMGRVGSIGVVTLHADQSAALERRGVKVTVLSAGGFKADGNPYEPLPAAVAARIRADLENARQAFAAAVAQGRGGRMSLAQALATEAADFTGEEAVALGLADAIGHSNEAFDAFAAQIRARSTRPKGFSMTTAALSAARAAEATASAAPAQPVLPLDAMAAGREAGLAAGQADGRLAERRRINAILSHAEADGRADLARYFAFETDMSADVVAAALGKAAKAAPAAPAATTAADPGLLAEMAAAGRAAPGPGVAAAALSVFDAEMAEGAAMARRALNKSA